MELKMYQVDAFADKLFSGNPAAVVILESTLKDEDMQSKNRTERIKNPRQNRQFTRHLPKWNES